MTGVLVNISSVALFLSFLFWQDCMYNFYLRLDGMGYISLDIVFVSSVVNESTIYLIYINKDPWILS